MTGALAGRRLNYRESMSGRANHARGLWAAVLLSLAAHVVLTALALYRRAPIVTTETAPKELPDIWAGTTLDIAMGELAATPQAASEPKEPAPQTTPEPEAKPERTSEAPPTTPKARQAAVKDPDGAPPAPKSQREPKSAAETHPPAAAQTVKSSRAASAGAAASSASASSSDAPTGTFGSDAVPAPRQFGRALTRAIAPANQADDAWAKRAIGSAGSLLFDVTIGEDGHVVDFVPVDRNPPEHLTGMLKRAFALLRGGVFAVRGDTTSGTERFKLSVTVSDVAGENIAGGHAALDWGFDSGQGHSSFTQSNGRHVEIRLELLPFASSKKR